MGTLDAAEQSRKNWHIDKKKFLVAEKAITGFWLLAVGFVITSWAFCAADGCDKAALMI